MTMNNKLTYFIVLMFCITSCEKINNDHIEGTLSDKYTGEPLANVSMVFDARKGGGFFTFKSTDSETNDRHYAVSKSNGSFIIDNLGLDIKYRFDVHFIRPEIFDSTATTWKYLTHLSSDSLWVKKGFRTDLKLRPAAITTFNHPKPKNEKYEIDTILINTYNQSDYVTKEKSTSDEFYLLPSKDHSIELTYIDNGKETRKTITHYISTAFTEDSTIHGWQRIRYKIDIPE